MYFLTWGWKKIRLMLSDFKLVSKKLGSFSIFDYYLINILLDLKIKLLVLSRNWKLTGLANNCVSNRLCSSDSLLAVVKLLIGSHNEFFRLTCLSCFVRMSHLYMHIVVLFRMLFLIAGTSVHACDVACMLQMMELELKKLEETIKNIHEEMFYLRER